MNAKHITDEEFREAEARYIKYADSLPAEETTLNIYAHAFDETQAKASEGVGDVLSRSQKSAWPKPCAFSLSGNVFESH